MRLSETDNYYRNILNKELVKIERKIDKIFKNREPNSLYDPGYYILNNGGKRLRPVLVALCAKAVSGGKVNALNAAVAVELLHNFTLIHDDIMDNSDLRRGKSAVHVKYGVNSAILTGDALIALAYKYLLKDSKTNAVNIFDKFTNGLVEVCEGQSLDTEFEKRKNISVEEYLIMIYKKTGALIEACCTVGGSVGGGSNKEISALRNYGKNLGLAFQIKDDLLDIDGDENNTGKPVGGDLLEGKKTYLFLRALEKSRGQDKKLLLKVIRDKGIGKKSVPIYKEIYDKLGALTDAENEVRKFTKRAQRHLNSIQTSLSKELLYWLANSLNNRIK